MRGKNRSREKGRASPGRCVASAVEAVAVLMVEMPWEEESALETSGVRGSEGGQDVVCMLDLDAATKVAVLLRFFDGKEAGGYTGSVSVLRRATLHAVNQVLAAGQEAPR